MKYSIQIENRAVKQIKALNPDLRNRILDELFRGHPEFELRFRELIGHTRIEIAAGAILGILLALWWT